MPLEKLQRPDTRKPSPSAVADPRGVNWPAMIGSGSSVKISAIPSSANQAAMHPVAPFPIIATQPAEAS